MLKIVFFIIGITSLFANKQLLTDPMLQNPTPQGINVVWFTEFEGTTHYVEYGEDLSRRAECHTIKLSHLREDKEDQTGCVNRPVYRHEATLTGLAQKTAYRVVSVVSELEVIKSAIFSCSPLPQAGTPLKILFTSDHQLKPMVAANLQKVQETSPIDAIFFAGDLVTYADRGSDWFDDKSGGVFSLASREKPIARSAMPFIKEELFYKQLLCIQPSEIMK